jgi:PDZ domain-containing protein
VIAGTGTIEHQLVGGVSTWIVGPIGGAYQKVIAAERAGVDVFFVPDDPATDEDNYTDALAAFATLKNSDMDIVPVRYFEDALEYLEGLHA